LDIHSSDRVDVKVVEPTPAFLLKGNVSEHVIPNLEEFAVRSRPTGGIQGLAKRGGYWLVPRSLVELVIRRGRRVFQQLPRILDFLPGAVSVEVHDVVRVHEADEEAPRLALVRERPAHSAKPGDRAAGDQVIELVAAERVADEIAGPDVIRE